MSIESVLEELRREYIPALKAEVAALGAAVEKQDYPDARRLAHRLAGTAGSYGFEDVSAAARVVEKALDAQDYAALGPAVASITQCANNV